MTSAPANAPPAATLLVLSFNQERFIAEAVKAALAQTFSPLEIVFSDDCSTDRTFEIVESLVRQYRGPHRLRMNRNDRNLGIAANINRAMSFASATIVVVAAGDDISLPHRVDRLVSAFLKDPSAYSVHSNMAIIDQSGSANGTWIEAGQQPVACTLDSMVEGSAGVLGAAHAWRREIFDVFGPMDERVIREDAAIPFRAALLGRVIYVDEVLVLYRRHQSNLYRFRNTLSPQELQSDWRRHCAGNLGVYSTMVHDLQTFSALFPERSAEVDEARRAAATKLELSELEQRFLLAASGLQRGMILARAWRISPDKREVARWAAMQWLPGMYLARLRHGAARARHA